MFANQVRNPVVQFVRHKRVALYVAHGFQEFAPFNRIILHDVQIRIPHFFGGQFHRHVQIQRNVGVGFGQQVNDRVRVFIRIVLGQLDLGWVDGPRPAVHDVEKGAEVTGGGVHVALFFGRLKRPGIIRLGARIDQEFIGGNGVVKLVKCLKGRFCSIRGVEALNGLDELGHGIKERRQIVRVGRVHLIEVVVPRVKHGRLVRLALELGKVAQQLGLELIIRLERCFTSQDIFGGVQYIRFQHGVQFIDFVSRKFRALHHVVHAFFIKLQF